MVGTSEIVRCSPGDACQAVLPVAVGRIRGKCPYLPRASSQSRLWFAMNSRMGGTVYSVHQPVLYINLVD